jgi:GntR family transcriptional regulator
VSSPRASGAEAARQARLAQKRALQTSSRRAHNLLRSSIRMGLMPSADNLMEHTLVSGLATSRNAVREALQLLADEGLVERSPRTGTRLVGSILEVPLDQFLPLVADGPVAGARVQARLMESRTVPATPVLASRLEVEVGDPLEMNEQLILVDGNPVALRCCYIVGSFISTPSGSWPPGGYAPADMTTALVQMFGPIAAEGTVENYLGAEACEPRTAERLGVGVGTPILSRELLIRNGAGQPYLFGYARYRGDRIAISAGAPIGPPAPPTVVN